MAQPEHRVRQEHRDAGTALGVYAELHRGVAAARGPPQPLRVSMGRLGTNGFDTLPVDLNVFGFRLRKLT